jgi:hypothetical protein
MKGLIFVLILTIATCVWAESEAECIAKKCDPKKDWLAKDPSRIPGCKKVAALRCGRKRRIEECVSRDGCYAYAANADVPLIERQLCRHSCENKVDALSNVARESFQ